MFHASFRSRGSVFRVWKFGPTVVEANALTLKKAVLRRINGGALELQPPDAHGSKLPRIRQLLLVVPSLVPVGSPNAYKKQVRTCKSNASKEALLTF